MIAYAQKIVYFLSILVCFILLAGGVGNMSDEKRIAPLSKEVRDAISRSLGEELAGSISMAFGDPKGLIRDGKAWIGRNQHQSVDIKTPLRLHHLERILEALDNVWSETRDESYADILVTAKIVDENEKNKNIKYLYRSHHGFDRQ